MQEFCPIILTALILLTTRSILSEKIGSQELIEGLSHYSKVNQETMLTFTLSARKLPSRDHHSNSDPFVELYAEKTSANKTDRLGQFGKTEKVMNDENPNWPQVFRFSWVNGTGQKWKFQVRDHDLLMDDDLGQATLEVDEYVRNGQNMTLNLTQGGHLLIAKTVPIYFRLSASNIPSRDLNNGASDPYIKIFYRTLKFPLTPIGKTRVIKNQENPNFLSDLIEFANWQEGTGQKLYFQVMDKDHILPDDVLGDALLDADEFVQGGLEKTVELANSRNGATLSIIPA